MLSVGTQWAMAEQGKSHVCRLATQSSLLHQPRQGEGLSAEGEGGFSVQGPGRKGNA